MQVNYYLKRSSRKTIGLKVSDGKLYVYAPYVASKKDIDKMIVDHLDWIEKKMNNPRINVNFNLAESEYAYIWGNRYKIEISPASRFAMSIEEDTLYLAGKSINSIEKNFRLYLCKQVENQVEIIKKELGIDFFTRYKIFKSKWGVCYKSKKLIVLNYLLACLPIECCKGVIYHEIAHFKVSNHQKEFYNHLLTLYPDYKNQAKIMKKFTIE